MSFERTISTPKFIQFSFDSAHTKSQHEALRVIERVCERERRDRSLKKLHSYTVRVKV